MRKRETRSRSRFGISMRISQIRDMTSSVLVSLPCIHFLRGLRLLFVIAGLTGGGTTPLKADTIDFEDFTDVSAWTLNGAASQVSPNIQLTPESNDQAGTAWLTNTFEFFGNYSFDSQFTIRINSSSGSGNADGITFAITDGLGNTYLGGTGGSLGLAAPYGPAPTKSVAVTFDTHGPDPGPHHIDIIRTGESIYTSPGATPTTLPFNQDIDVWVDYDGDSNVMEVFIDTSGTGTKPVAAFMMETVDLNAIFGGTTQLTVGFTAATGGTTDEHLVKSFSLIAIPEPSSLALLGAGTLGVGLVSRLRKKLTISSG